MADLYSKPVTVRGGWYRVFCEGDTYRGSNQRYWSLQRQVSLGQWQPVQPPIRQAFPSKVTAAAVCKELTRSL